MSRLLFSVVLLFSCSTSWAQQDSLIVKSIFFGGGSYYIDDEQANELNEFINSIEKLEHYEVIIFGHTDDIGSKEYNEWLSQMRSKKVYQKLLELKVPEELMEIKSFGFTNPLYTNRTHSGRVMNRRVDVILSPIVF